MKPTLAPAPDLSGPQLWERLQDHVRQATGVVLSPYTAATCLQRLHELARASGKAPAAFLAGASPGTADGDRLFDAVCVKTTWFNREPAGVRALADALARRASASGTHQVRIWSAACSTGEEAYTAAMAFLDVGLVPEVLATDLSASALDHAARATYPASCLAAVPESWRARYFEPPGGRSVRVAAAVAARVRFARHNLTSAAPSAAGGVRYDAILCRNVLLYFEREQALSIVEQLARCCTSDGYLLLGVSERTLVWSSSSTVVPDEEYPHLLRRSRRPAPPVHAPARAAVAAPPAPPAAPVAGPLERTASPVDLRFDGGELPAQADPSDASAHVVRGLGLKRANRVAEAIDAFLCARSFAVHETWLPTYQLALCFEELGRMGDALLAFEDALAALEAGAPAGLPAHDAEARALAPIAAESCRRRLALLRRQSSAVAGGPRWTRR
jgi:chemotaxis methyl-accepting protein methylase